jgi:SPP1 gp7 family putative phage head morphogenesis protein
MKRRFKKLSQNIQELIVNDDALGLSPNPPLNINQQVPRQVWRFLSDDRKVSSFRAWLRQQIDAGILEVGTEFQQRPWMAIYIESAYCKGAIRAYTDLRAEQLATEETIFQGGREEFIRQAFSQGEALSKIELLYNRAFRELEGVTAAMDQQMSRILAEGLTQGHGIRRIARDLRDNVSKITNTRALLISRTEIVRAHSEGQLDTFERLGVEKVGVVAEWSTAGDEKVCAMCEPLDGTIMTIKEARGLIPRHPNCRCAWIPADKKVREKGQLRGRRRDKAVRDSIKAEFPAEDTLKRAQDRSTWAGKEIL